MSDDPELEGRLLAEMQQRVGDATSDLADIQVDAQTHGWQEIVTIAAATEDLLGQLHAEITTSPEATNPRPAPGAEGNPR